MRALSYARASRPSMLEAVTVDINTEETRALSGGVGETADPRALRVLASPSDRSPADPRLRALDPDRRPAGPRHGLPPGVVIGRWWEQVLHNHSALRLKARLLFTPGVMVVSVPWQLASSEGAERD